MNRKLLFNVTKRFCSEMNHQEKSIVVAKRYLVMAGITTIAYFPLMKAQSHRYKYGKENDLDIITGTMDHAIGAILYGLLWPITSLIGLYHIATKQTHKI